VKSRFLVLHLLYLENRMGCWAGPQTYARVGFRDTIWPFNHRDAIGALIRLPPRYSHEARFVTDIIRSRWPELLEIPFNQALTQPHTCP
jgi:hypothetical protein